MKTFYNPDEDREYTDDETIESFAIEEIQIIPNDNDRDDGSIDLNSIYNDDDDDEWLNESSDSDSMDDSDDSDEDLVDNGSELRSGEAPSNTERSTNDDIEDDVINAIIEASNKPKTHPPDIQTDDFVVDLSFHPTDDLLAVGLMTGDVLIYKYGLEENTLLNTLEVHTKSIRAVEFNLEGDTVFSTARDKSIMLSDVHTGKLKQFYENVHESVIYRMNVFSENLFATGDDDGVLKVWDIRDSSQKSVQTYKEVDDYISSILTNREQKLLLTTSGDGYLTCVNLSAKKLFVQSEPYEEELTCMGLFRQESKLIVGSSKGTIYTFNWKEFGLHGDKYPGPKSPISLMVPVTERMCVVAGEEGILRATHVVPGRSMGVVGQHSLGVEAMDICNTGEFIASSSHDNDIKFWNIRYFEDFQDLKYGEKHNKAKERQHNLPSSRQKNVGDFFADLM